MLADTIFAIASPPGPAARAVLRLSGPAARQLAALVFKPSLSATRARVPGTVYLADAEFAAFALVMPGPRSYTGEDVVELHLPGSPLLCALLQEDLAARGASLGARLAHPGEFTRRAYEHGRLDLLQAEAVLQLITADDATALRSAASQLHGGLSAAVGALRTQLQDVLSLLEAGLDFTDDETGAVPASLWSPPLHAAHAACLSLAQSLPAARAGGEVLLLGAANAGKSSLCNALAGRTAVLVADAPGTTRDLLRVEVAPGVAVWDAPGDLDAPNAIDAAALQLRQRLGGSAAAALLVVDPAAPRLPATPLPILAVVVTKQDLGLPAPTLPFPPAVPILATSVRTGAGLPALRAVLTQAATAGVRQEPLARAPLHAAAAALGRAVDLAAASAGPELCAVDVQHALRELDRIDGSHSPEDLLDRIFGRFCLGK